MLKTRSLTVAALFVTASMAASLVEAESTQGDWCEQQWEIVSGDPGEGLQPSYKDILARWQQYGGKCAGSVAYEARLAILYAQMNEPAKAREVLKKVAGKKSDYDHLVEIASLQTEMSEVFADNRGDKRPQMKALEGKYAAFVRKYPNFIPGYSMLGGIQSALDEHPEAIQTLIAGLNNTPKDKRRSPNLWSMYRNLAISYAGIGDYRKALGAADVAYELKKGISSDRYFMYAMAKACAATEDFKAAQDVLNVVAARVPEVKNDPKFQSTVRFLADKIQESKQQQK